MFTFPTIHNLTIQKTQHQLTFHLYAPADEVGVCDHLSHLGLGHGDATLLEVRLQLHRVDELALRCMVPWCCVYIRVVVSDKVESGGL